MTRRFLPSALAVVVIMVSAELTARLDDWLFQDVPLAAAVDREHDLILHDTLCVRGRPHGSFKKYRLNAFGFRGAEITRDKPPGVTRVMILGASEAFGLYESEQHEFAEVLRQTFATQGGAVQVVNAAVAGMALPSLLAYWDHWASGFRPDIVLIYPSPQFYLDDDPPRAVTPRPDLEERAPVFRSRILPRLAEAARRSDLIRDVRVRVLLWRALSGQAPSWPFAGLPQDRLADLGRDLVSLADAVARTGAIPVLVTHAFKSPAALDGDDTRELRAFRIFFPRAEPRIIQQFDAAAAQETLAVARAHHWPVIDASARLSGRRDLFADPVHFNDAGSEAMARLLADELSPLLARTTPTR